MRKATHSLKHQREDPDIKPTHTPAIISQSYDLQRRRQPALKKATASLKRGGRDRYSIFVKKNPLLDK